MSIALPDVDLSTASVGTKGVIALQNMGISAGGVSAHPSALKNFPTLFIHNESGCGLGITLKDSQQSFNLAAGQWVPIVLGPGESAVQWVVKYVLPNAPVNLLMTTYYFPGEPIPDIAVLGNSPIGIGGSVSTQVTTLSNEGNPINTLVEDVGTPTTAQLLQIWNDHMSWRVEQSGVAHTILQGKTSGNPLQLGQAGDNTEVLGTLIVDTALAVNTPTTDLTGDTAGVAHCYEDLRGSVKRIVIILDGYKHVAASSQQFVLSVPFLKGGWIRCGNTNTAIELRTGAVNTPIIVITAINNGVSNATISPYEEGDIQGGFDRVLLPQSMGSTVTHGTIIIEGN
jgi:hypothetical protein